MNWKNIFLAGIILSASPFYLPVPLHIRNHFFIIAFYYSVLGYGMIIVAFFYKKREPRDYLIFSSLLLTIVSGLMGLTDFYNLFTYIFITLFVFFYLNFNTGILSRIGGYAITASIGFYAAASLEAYYGLIYFPEITALRYAPIYFTVLIFIAVILAYRDLPS